MNERDALQKALQIIDAIDRLAEDPLDPGDAVDEIHDLTGSVIGELARAGFVAEPTS